MGFLNGFLTFLLVLFSVALITLVTMQTPKSEGFTGGVTNVTGGGFRGKAGVDEMLSNYTRFVAIGWFATAFILGIVSRYTG